MPANRPVMPVLITGALLAIAACSRASSKTPGAGPPDDPDSAPAPTNSPSATAPPSLAASCELASIGAGRGPVACTATLTNADDAITWTLTGPGALSSSTGAAVDYTPPALLDAEASAHVVAAVAGLMASFEIRVLPGPPTRGVSGHVVDAVGHPVAGVVARVAGHAAATTDEAGAFTILEVAPPYDLVLSTSGPGRSVSVYAGLTRNDPTVAIYQDSMAATGVADRSAELAGQVQGGDQAGKLRRDYQSVLFGSAEMPAGDPLEVLGVGIATPPRSYRFPVRWRGASTLHGAVLAVQLRVDPTTATPTAYWLATMPEVEVAHGATASVPPLELAAAKVVTTEGTVRLPPGYALELTSAQLAPAAMGPAFTLFYDDNAGLPWGGLPIFRYVLPALEGAAVRLCARAAGTAAHLLDSVAMGCAEASGLAAVEVAVMAAPEPIVPPNGANAVGPDTVFAWQAFQGGVSVLEATPDDPDDSVFMVFTAGSHATLPDLDDARLALRSRASYHWRVRGLAPVTSVDALAAPSAVPVPLDYPSPPAPRWAWGRSRAYQFIVR